MTQDELKQAVAEAALAYVRPKLDEDTVLGIGTGSTANLFIDCLESVKGLINATVASSEASAARLKSHGIPVYDLNSVDQVDFYIDGADESNRALQTIRDLMATVHERITMSSGSRCAVYRPINPEFIVHSHYLLQKCLGH